MAVPHELPRLGARRREPEAVHDIVQALLEHDEKVLAGDPLAPVRFREVGPELGLEHAVNPLHLLLLAQLQAVTEGTAAAARAVLARREVAALDRALLLETAISLEEQLHPFAAAEPANGSCISGHLISLLDDVLSPRLRGLQLGKTPAPVRPERCSAALCSLRLTRGGACAAGSRCGGWGSRL